MIAALTSGAMLLIVIVVMLCVCLLLLAVWAIVAGDTEGGMKDDPPTLNTRGDD